MLYNNRTTLCHFEKTQNPGFITNVDDNERCFGKAYFNDVHFLGYHFFSLPIFDIKSYIREIRDAQAELILEVEHSKISYRESYPVILIIPDSLEINELTIHYKNSLALQSDHFTPVQNQYRGSEKKIYNKKTFVIPFSPGLN